MYHIKFNLELETLKYHNSSLVISIHFCYNIHLSAQLLYYFTNNKVYNYGLFLKGDISEEMGGGMEMSILVKL